ncbi:MAG: SpoIIE family protein phosphatase [Acidobacteriota bacterium]|nr:SpoIIE family protein phosphatase [Acidobacteriota bacterium]
MSIEKKTETGITSERRPCPETQGERFEITDASTMSFLMQTAEELTATLEIDEVLAKVAERVKDYVAYDSFAVLLLDDLGQDLRFHFGIGFSQEVLEHWRFGLGQGIVGTAAKSCRSVRVDDVRADPRYINAQSDMRSEMAIPLIVKGTNIGVLDVQSREPAYFTEYHERLLAFLAGHVANAIDRSRLYQNLRAQATSLSLLNEAGRELTSILDLEALFHKVAALVKRVVNYDHFSAMLWNDDDRVLEHSFSQGSESGFREKTGFPLGHGITGTAASLRQAIRVPNVHIDPRYVTCGHEVDVRSELVVPLVFKDRLIGVIDLESTEYNAFSEQDESILTTFASYIAIAMENARLYERVRRDEQRLADDMETAREIQKGLLPDSAPATRGLDIGFAYEPARQLGGDFYDFLPYPGDRLAIAVGDVAGKAAAAALQGSLAVGVLREHAITHPCGPAEMLAHMNANLDQPRLANRFVAMAMAVYDANDRTMTVGNAGFPRPHLMRDGKVEELDVLGIPLGLMPGSEYQETKVALQVGDIVVFCSDGVHECANREGEEYGSRRLAALLAEHAGDTAGSIADRILKATDLHGGGNGEHADDRTVVVLKVTA